MQYSNIRSRAGLVALVFALIISLVSAVPIPATDSGLSSTFLSLPNLSSSHNRYDDPTASGTQMSTSPTAIRALTPRHISTDMDDQLVRRSAGSKIKKAFQNFGHRVKTGFQKFGRAIKKVAQKVGHGIKIAAQKAGQFIKTTGAKIVKFGAKVVQAVGNAIGKVAGLIPGVGKVINRVISGVTKVAGVISDKIHVSLGKKLAKGMNVMNKANKVMGYIPIRRHLSEEEEAFQQRDISDAYYFEERDDIALEDREDSYFEAYERDIYERYDLDEE